MWNARVIFAVLNVLGLLASLATHLSTFADDPVVAPPWAWGLHVGIFLVCAPAFLLARSGDAGASADGLFAHSPRWMVVASVGFFVYALINFGIFLRAVEGSAGRRPDGTYYLHRKGTFVRELTAAEYRRHE